MGGPDGGDGGRWQHFYHCRPQSQHFVDFRYTRKFMGQRGENGHGADRHGTGADIDLYVPVGTVVTDIESGEVIADLDAHDKVLIAGRGRQRWFG